MLKYIILIILVFAVLILGQQTYFKNIGRDLYEKVEGWGSMIYRVCKTYLERNILKRVTSEIEKRQNIAKQEIKEQTKEAGQNIWEKIKNYFWGIFRQAPQENK